MIRRLVFLVTHGEMVFLIRCHFRALYCIVLYCIYPFLYRFSQPAAFQKRSRPQQLTLYRSLHAEALQAIAGKGLAQGPYMAARATVLFYDLQCVCRAFTDNYLEKII